LLVIKAIVEYDGTDFSGFQRQPNRRTVQGELERSLESIFREPVKVIGSGRTDAGVHARGQAISFTAPEQFPADKICLALNSELPIDIRVQSSETVGDDFHARYSAKSRTYIYVVLNREAPSALLARYVWHLRNPLDLSEMRRAADGLVGIRDFASFGMPDKPGASTIREIKSIRIAQRKSAVFFAVRGNAFLRGMVRAIVGTLVEVGTGRRNPDDMSEILAAGSRDAVKVIAPSRGLYLTSVEY
jgi:tRNA pseudouridine38-40 synthase